MARLKYFDETTKTWKYADVASDTQGPGHNEEDGFSPIVTVEQTDDGVIITITDKQGTTTATVTNGKNGKDGATGPQGPKGDTGATGPQGEQGPKGAQGPAGSAGVDGKSAYQYAVDGGYTGTEADFAKKMASESTTEEWVFTLADGSQVTKVVLVG